MSGCVRHSLLRCVQHSRLLSDIRFVKKGETTTTTAGEQISKDNHLIDLGTVHREWKAAGYFPKAPAHIVNHGTKCLQALAKHYNLYNHVFNGREYRLFALRVKQGSKEIDFGTLVSPTKAAQPPEIDWSTVPMETDKKYTVVMLSPDGTDCSMHWCVSNIAPRDVTTTPRDVTTTSRGVTMTTLLPYVPPVPLKGTGFYRYAIVLLEQANELLSVTTPPDSVTTSPDSVTTSPVSVTTSPDSVTTPPDSVTTPPDSVTTTLSSLSRSSTLEHLVEVEKMTPVGLAFYQASWDRSVGRVLATQLDADERQYGTERTKATHEHYAEEKFLFEEWQMKTGFM